MCIKSKCLDIASYSFVGLLPNLKVIIIGRGRRGRLFVQSLSEFWYSKVQVVRRHSHALLYGKELAYRHRTRGDERNLNFERPAFPVLTSLETGAMSASPGADGGNQSSTWNEASVRLLHSGMIERLQYIPSYWEEGPCETTATGHLDLFCKPPRRNRHLQ